MEKDSEQVESELYTFIHDFKFKHPEIDLIILATNKKDFGVLCCKEFKKSEAVFQLAQAITSICIGGAPRE